MTRNPMMHGAAAGLVVPIAFLAPTYLWGPLPEILSAGRTYFLLPATALLLVPGGFLGALATRVYAERRETWRFAAGLLAGGSLAGSLLFSIGNAGFVTALAGGVLLVGFWEWLGALLGIAYWYGRREGKPSLVGA